MKERGFLRGDAIVEPLWNAWHAWTLLVPPATAGSVVARHLLPPLASFVDDPEEHARILRSPQAPLGGPWVAIDPARVEEARELLHATHRSLARHLAVAEAWRSLDQLLRAHRSGLSLEPLYAAVPECLRGFVELVFDRRNIPAAKPFERLFYQELHDASLEAFDLFPSSADERPFVFSTPRLPGPGRVRAHVPFTCAAIDTLCNARLEQTALGPLADALGLPASAHDDFDALFTSERIGEPSRFSGEGVRVRYFGHACVLLESKSAAILVDPWIGPGVDGELGFQDLPARIDYVLVTHSHADHLVLETLLQLRGRIGTVIVPRSGWSMLDPSLGTLLEQLGFTSVREVDALEEIRVDGGAIVALPFLGEHADLAIRAKATYHVSLGGKGVFFAADANNLEPRIYELAARRLGPVDVLFIGMECAGAPLDWLYGHFLSEPVSAEAIASRRLDGSDAAKALSLVDAVRPTVAAFVYAMGIEPWLQWLSAVRYDARSLPIVESDRFVAACQARDLHAERLEGTRELILSDGD